MSWNDFDNFPWAVPLGSVLRIPVRLHVTFFIPLLAQTLSRAYHGGWAVLLWILLLGPLLLATVLIHELGHCLAARSIGGTVDRVVLWPLGGMSYVSYHTSYKKAIWVAAAGPLTHIPMVGVWLVLLVPAHHASTGSWRITLKPPEEWGGRHFGHALCVYAIGLNIALLALHLLVPAHPLGGGRILALLMRGAGAGMRAAAIASVAIATPIGLALFVLGCLLPSVALTLLALFILFSTAQLLGIILDGDLAAHPLFAPVRRDDGAGPAAAADAAGHPSAKSGVAGPPAGAVAGPSEPAGGGRVEDEGYPASATEYYIGSAV